MITLDRVQTPEHACMGYHVCSLINHLCTLHAASVITSKLIGGKQKRGERREREKERKREKKKLHQSITLRSAHLPQRIPRQPKTYILHITPDPPTTQNDTMLLENLVRPLPPPTPEFFAPIGQGRRGCAC